MRFCFMFFQLTAFGRRFRHNLPLFHYGLWPIVSSQPLTDCFRSRDLADCFVTASVDCFVTTPRPLADWFRFKSYPK